MRRIDEPVLKEIAESVLNSYSVVFFSDSRILSLTLLAVTMFNLPAGLSGLAAVLSSVLVARKMGFDSNLIRKGIYTFNALLTGIGLGTFFDPGIVFFTILLLASLCSLILSVALGGWLGKYGLPFLSLPFIISFWLGYLPAGHLGNLGLTQRNVFWMNEMYSIGGKHLLDFFQTIETLPLNRVVTFFLRSLSSIFFQENMLAGILIAAALLASSRISFLLAFTGFVTASLFAAFTGSEMAGYSAYNVGANYILVAIAAGGFFTIPSVYSFLWAVLLVPLTSLVLLFLNDISEITGLPVFSLPFSVITIVYIYFLQLRTRQQKPVLTPIQHSSPEKNLYSWINNTDRLANSVYLPFSLPFWGEWKVSQGYDGEHTHKDEWGKALDFVISDSEGMTHRDPFSSPESYYCYGKPVLAPADGIVAEVTDNINDNPPGTVNTVQNWGNSIVISHVPGLCSQLSHLKPGSIKVRKGDFVRKGEIIASCGNSGRSPEPHLHFQLQPSPFTGSRTMAYPVSYFLSRNGLESSLRSFTVPAEGEIVSNVTISGLLSRAFDLQPGMVIKFNYRLDEQAGEDAAWEIFTDQYNYKYLYCQKSKSSAYFVNDGTMFYFTAFYGDRNSLLYYFYLVAYKVILSDHREFEITDKVPLHNLKNNRLLLFVYDFAAPFRQFMKACYSGGTAWCDNQTNPSRIRVNSLISVCLGNRELSSYKGTVIVSENRISEFTFESENTWISAQRSDT